MYSQEEKKEENGTGAEQRCELSGASHICLLAELLG
jgi:hypothetical protein